MHPILSLLRLVAAGAVVPLGAQAPAEAPPAPRERPNIVVILADDLGYGDLGCYGQAAIQTPHLDRMAAEGLRFTQHYAGATVCAPSRSCLLTGQHTGHTPMRGNGDVALSADDVTLGHLLQAAGYRTAMIGKASTACRTDDPGQPNACGFDHFFGVLSHRAAHDYFPLSVVRNGEVLELAGNARHEGPHYSHDLFLAEARAFLAQRRDAPFFLLYSAQIPHASLYAPDAQRAAYLGTFDEVPVTDQKHYRNEPAPKATYAAMVSRLDWEVGQILDALEANGQTGSTLVLFASDNGAMNEGGHRRAAFKSSGSLRGGKRDLFEGGIRTPLLARWPGTVAPGVTDHVSAFWDFVPTLCALAGCEPPEGLDGISFAPTLLGAGEQLPHTHLYWEFHEQGGKRAVRFGSWKAIQLGVRKNPDGPVLLYDLERDPAEAHDVADDHPAVVARARDLFRSSATRSPVEAFNFPDR